MFGTRIKSLDEFIREKARGRRAEQAVLTATSYSVEVRSGLAFVQMTRKFENKEAKPIEAILTFPVPYEAAVTRISTVIDGRKLVGQAQPKAKARETYETAIDDGKAAILHEQLLKGLHMVSVANVKPGSHIEVVANFAAPVAMVGSMGKVRLPLTVGQIYGNLPMQDSDRLLTGGPAQFADVTIKVPTKARLNGRAIDETAQRVSLGAVIDIEIENHQLKPLTTATKDGRVVTVAFEMLAERQESMEIDLLLDASGSMSEIDNARNVKWNAMIDALTKVEALGLRDDDKVHLWVFATTLRYEGATTRKDLSERVRRITFDRGSTELDSALQQVAKSREGANILVITDGRAGELNVERMLSRGCRVTAVLLGGDALEANISHLAAVSGGQTFISFGLETERDIAAAINAMAYLAPALPVSPSRPGAVTKNMGGVAVTAKWNASKKPYEEINGLSAFAAYLALSGMTEDSAAIFSAEEGLVSHLTSIVLVDEAGEAVDGIPAQRKIALEESASAMRSYMAAGPAPMAAASMSFAASAKGGPLLMAAPGGARRGRGAMIVGSGFRPEAADPSDDLTFIDRSSDNDRIMGGSFGGGWVSDSKTGDVAGHVPSPSDIGDLSDYLKSVEFEQVNVPVTWTLKSSLATRPIDWDAHSNDLLAGDVDKLPLSIRARIKALTVNAAVLSLATKYALKVETVAIALLAYCVKDTVRTADRIQRRHLKGVQAADVESVLAVV
ncbi:VIT and VWA domain-containing protein [Rhizobium sp. MHM7A]|uniref:VIT and vWA domain-containing protein n=1 Tax=Rhizobium sp. MHM7A TaxID=2583233 RepID=UPI0011063B91|nr:VIT and VWA domain-containing protein [Rhizobium sp. MHM7A]TLX16465.1 VWA domain-containing protein [Rhizobium sp. MHM7A]